MADTDAIYVLIFGESLLNDSVAIVLFHTLVHFLDKFLTIDSEMFCSECDSVASLAELIASRMGSLGIALDSVTVPGAD